MKFDPFRLSHRGIIKAKTRRIIAMKPLIFTKSSPKDAEIVTSLSHAVAYDEISDPSDIRYLPADRICANPWQPRKTFEQSAIDALAESIETHGLLSPLTVRKLVDDESPLGGIYSLISGERRLRAMRKLGWENVPCMVLNASAQDGAAIAIVENLLRENLNFFEEASAIAALVECHGMSREEISRRLSLSPSAISNKLRLLRLAEKERGEILAAGLTERHARAIIRIESPEMRAVAIAETIERGLTVAMCEEFVNLLLTPALPAAKEAETIILERAESLLKPVNGENSAFEPPVRQEESLKVIKLLGENKPDPIVSRETIGKSTPRPKTIRCVESIERAVASLNAKCVGATSTVKETPENFEITVTIPKRAELRIARKCST